jgi:hypothetical protein
MKSHKKWFDNLILSNLKNKGFGPFGYPMGKETHPVYYSRDAFTAFKVEMGLCHPQHYYCYINGQGSELLETGTPPKMASVASSSRFAYLALRWGAEAIGGTQNVEFEHECRIRGIRGTAPQLDAYTTDKNGNPIYVEVKCHEIFDSHKIELNSAYHEHIYGKGNAFGFPCKQKDSAATKYSVPLNYFDIHHDPMMDIKQLMCHLMGIASQKDPEQPASLVYLFFKPIVIDDDNIMLNKIFTQLTEEIDCIFNSAPIKKFCSIHKIDLKVVIEEAPVMERLTAHNIGYQRAYPHK